MCARRFLFLVFLLTLLAVAGAVAIFQFGDRILLRNTVPKGEFVAPPPASGPDYADAASWISRPSMADDPSRWRPDGAVEPAVARAGEVAAFYIHPTTYLERDRWNALLDDRASRDRAELFVRSQASAFSRAADVWAPRYRQAAYGAFLLKSEDAQQALDLAFADVTAAFEHFLESIPAERPVILAAHSQGALHLSRLLAERGRDLQQRLVAAYVIGWPISVTADLPTTGLPPCRTADETGCVLSWQSFAEPANPDLILDAWRGTKGPTGIERERGDMLCVNPLTGTQDGSAPPQANPGTLVPSADMASAALVPGRVGGRCEQGFLIIEGAIPPLGPYVLPGNNFHVYDYALFWAAVRNDADRRARRWFER